MHRNNWSCLHVWALMWLFSQEALLLLQQWDIRLFSGNEIRIHKQSQISDFQESANVKYFPSYCIPGWDYLLDHKVSNKTLLTQVQRPDRCFYAVYYPAAVKVKGLLNLTSLCSSTLQLSLLDPLTSTGYLEEVSYETWQHLHWEVNW